ncbi:zinc metallopeptidase [Clostridium polynesiense]|uniref:zinc metallopeptidase n=1 Tax=Clostridium polynesiense TaxID=1325933 RepID=UPI00058E6F58|nr:zinc metallopeptidase [Clostridium polynesiense]
MYGYLDETMIILIPALLISLWAQTKISSTFNKYSRVHSTKGYTAAEVARMLLNESGLQDISIEQVSGNLTDHYDPRNRVLRLSQSVFHSTSVASIGVAAHEVGHAIQHKESYTPLVLRNTIVPLANIGSNFSWMLFFLGIILGYPSLTTFGILLFSGVVLFQLITLPVEFDASKRAIRILADRSILVNDEVISAKKVLNAAAMTYVAATLMAISQLFRLIALSNRNRD